MKTLLGFFMLIVAGSLQAEIVYPDQDLSDMLKKPEAPFDEVYEKWRVPGNDRFNVNFPVVQEEHDLDGDGILERWKVETVFVNTKPASWTGSNSGKSFLNSLAVWLILNNIAPEPGQAVRNKMIVRLEPCLTEPKTANGGMLEGIKVSFVRIEASDNSRLRPLLRFIPHLNVSGNMAHVAVPSIEVDLLEKKILAEYIASATDEKIVFKCSKSHHRPDGLVSFGGIWLGAVRVMRMPDAAIELKTPASYGGAIPSRVITDDEPTEPGESGIQNEPSKP